MCGIGSRRQHSKLAEESQVVSDCPGLHLLAVLVSNDVVAQRHAGLAQFAGLLASRDVLRPDISAEQARDIIWTLCSLAVHDLLVVDRGWSPARYRDWLAAALRRGLLEPG